MSPKTVLITGASAGGIGSALALSFQKRGFHFFATARSLSKIAHLASLSNVTALKLEVTSADSIAQAVEGVRAKVAELGCTGLDVLVNNSGVGYVMPLLDIDLEESKKLFDVNFWGVLAVTQAFASLLIDAKGSVVNISSLAGEIYTPYRGIYTASKAAVTQAGETLRLELAPLGVKVVTVVSGIVRTNFAANIADFKLPSKSRYLPIEKEVELVANDFDLPGYMDVNVYAEKVVNDILGGSNGLIWRGLLSTRVRFISKLFPAFLLDYIVGSNSGLNKLAGLVKSS